MFTLLRMFAACIPFIGSVMFAPPIDIVQSGNNQADVKMELGSDVLAGTPFKSLVLTVTPNDPKNQNIEVTVLATFNQKALLGGTRLVLCKIRCCRNSLASCTLQTWQENHNLSPSLLTNFAL